MPAARITADASGALRVPDEPVIPVVAGDGSGPARWRAARPLLEEAVLRAYEGRRRLHFQELPGGERARRERGDPAPAETVNAFRLHRVGLRGPMAPPPDADGRPVTLDGELREILDLFVAVLPVPAMPGPGAAGSDVVIVREEREDSAAGFEWRAGSSTGFRLSKALEDAAPEILNGLRFGTPEAVDAWLKGRGLLETGIVETGISVRAQSRPGAERLARAVLAVARRLGKRKVTWVHRAELLPLVEGSALVQAMEVFASAGRGAPALEDVRLPAVVAELLAGRRRDGLLAGFSSTATHLQLVLEPGAGGEGLLAAARLNPDTGHGVFEVRGSASLPGDDDDPVGTLRAGELLLRHLGWGEAADRLRQALDAVLASGTATAAAAPVLHALGHAQVREVHGAAFAREVAARL